MFGFGPIWPRISDRASAQRAANLASRWYILGALFTGALALIAMPSFGLLNGASSPITLIIDFFIFFNLVGGARASLKWRELDRLAVANDAYSPHPIEPQ